MPCGSIDAAAAVRSRRSRWSCRLCRCCRCAAAAQATRGVSLTEERVALVIGNAAYKRRPARQPGQRRAADRSARCSRPASRSRCTRTSTATAWSAALRDFGSRLNENTVAVLYYAGHGAAAARPQLPDPGRRRDPQRGRDPASPASTSGFILGRMSRAKSRINIVILDACRDNPFAKRRRRHRQRRAWRRWTRRSARCSPSPPRRASRRPTASASAATASTPRSSRGIC